VGKYGANEDVEEVLPVVALDQQTLLVLLVVDIPDESVHAPMYNYCFAV
jgi:hypothetical protein